MRLVLLGIVALVAWCCVCATQQGCDPQWGVEMDQGITVFIHWPARIPSLIPSGTEAIRITVDGPGIAAPGVVRDIARPALPGNQVVDIEVPAGPDRVVTAEAFDAGGALLGRDSASGVVIRPGEVAEVTLALLTNGTLRLTID